MVGVRNFWNQKTGMVGAGQTKCGSQREKALKLKFYNVWLPTRAIPMGGSGMLKDKIIEGSRK